MATAEKTTDKAEWCEEPIAGRRQEIAERGYLASDDLSR